MEFKTRRNKMLKFVIDLRVLLLGHTNSATVTASSLGVLTADTEAPAVTKTTVVLHLLEHLKIVTELGVETVSKDLAVGAVSDILLSVEHPNGDLELGGVLHDGNNLVDLLRLELTSATAGVDVGLLADHASETGANTTDGSKGEDNLLLTVDVSVEHTKDVLEMCVGNERLY